MTAAPDVKRYECQDHTAGGYFDPHEWATCPDCQRYPECKDGLYVRNEDYEALLADRERLAADIAAMARLAEATRARLIHMREYWNGDCNDRAMSDALNHLLDECDAGIAAFDSQLALSGSPP